MSDAQIENIGYYQPIASDTVAFKGATIPFWSSLDQISSAFTEVAGAAAIAFFSARIPTGPMNLSSVSAVAITPAQVYSPLRQTYDQVRSAISHFTNLDEDEEWYIDADASSSGSAFLDVLKKSSIPVPKVFPHETESLVFSWRTGEGQRLITVSEHQGVVQNYGRNGDVSGPPEYYDLSDGQSVVRLVSMLGGNLWNPVREASQTR